MKKKFDKRRLLPALTLAALALAVLALSAGLRRGTPRWTGGGC